MHTRLPRFALIASTAVGLLLAAPGPVRCQIGCDSLYCLLQNMAVNHVGGNEVWVDYFLGCPDAPDTIGGFVLSAVNQEGKMDRAVIAAYQDRAGWQYRFGERARNIRFVKPSPRMDIDGDGSLDLVFTAADDAFPRERGYRILFRRGNTYAGLPELRLPRAMVIDSILPAPPHRARPLLIADRRGWEVGGLRPSNAPVSHRYLGWNRSSDTGKYVDQTSSHMDMFPDVRHRAAFIKSLPVSGELRFAEPEKYEEFLINLVGYMLDQSNSGREQEGFEVVRPILDRLRYEGSTQRLQSPAEVRAGLIKAIPTLRQLEKTKK